ncbi:MAG: TRAP transporter large permease [Alphaproteobacteria bacterium]|nr:TRAP transporter large permease [Alphaproteobacteria bacterium]
MDLMPLIVLVVAMCLGAPVGTALGASALWFFIFADGVPHEAFVQKIQSSFGSYPLLAIPLFIFAASILNMAGVSQRLFDLADALVGRTVGGLGKVNVIMATLMGGISASAAADAAMQAKLVGQPMVNQGYPRAFVSAIIASSAVITPIIPPGIGFILYGAMTETSIGQLFAAGIVPGLLMCVALVTVVHVVTKIKGYDRLRTTPPAADWPSRVRRMRLALRRASLALAMPIFIVVGIRYGVFTPTEAGGVLVLIGLFFGFVVYRELRLGDIGRAIAETMETTASLMLIVCFSTAFAFYLTWEMIPQQVTQLVLSHTNDKYTVILAVNVILLLVGTFLETIPAMIILVPLIHPIALRLGIDPVHIGVIVVVNLTLGSVTPPVGILMFLANGVLGTTVAEFTRASIPFIGAIVAVLALISAFPDLCLAIPRALY